MQTEKEKRREEIRKANSGRVKKRMFLQSRINCD
jgi:hypothetical protein